MANHDLAYRSGTGELCTVRTLTDNDVAKLSADHTTLVNMQTTVADHEAAITQLQDDVEKALTPSTDENNAFTLGSDGNPYVKDLQPEIDELKLYKFPNATIVGTPVVNNGQISGFTSTDYLQFPFIVDFKGRPFVINTAFTTNADVTHQQNIFDSDYGFAFAIRDSKFVIAMSSDGQSWNLGESVGTYTVLPSTTYKVRLSWDGNTYKVDYSTDNGDTYINDISKSSTESLYPKQIYIGVGMNHGTVLNSFKGSINFNYCDLLIGGNVVWQGMDDVGIASRLATDMSNLDSAGEAKIKEVASDMAVVSRTVAGATQDTILAIDEADITDILPKASTAQYGLYKVPEVVVTDLVPLINESTSAVKIASGKLFMTRCGNIVSISAQNLHIVDETVNTNYFTFYRLPSPACGTEQHAVGFRNLKATDDFFWVDTARGHTLSIRIGSTLSGQGMYGTVTYITNEA